MPPELQQFADQMAQFEEEVDSTKTPTENAEKNGKNKNGANKEKDEDMNPEEAMEFFKQLMGMQGAAHSEQKSPDFMPDLNDLPKLNEVELQQFKQLMNQDNCSIM